MSDTPRTDAEQFQVDMGASPDGWWVVDAAFARQLERELTNALNARDSAEIRLEKAAKYLNEVCSWHSDPDSYEYNECDINPCEFCQQVKKIIP